MVVSTDVERVYLKFKTPDQKPLCRCDVRTAKQLLADGEFLEGSMKPKIEAAVEFLEAGGREVIITDPLNLVRAVDGQTGTHITNS
jgi:carbamate kinase